MKISPVTAVAGAAIIVALAGAAAIDAWSAATIGRASTVWVELSDERNGLQNPAYLDVLPREGETVTILDPPLGEYRVKRVEHLLQVDVARGPFVPAIGKPAYRVYLDGIGTIQ